MKNALFFQEPDGNTFVNLVPLANALHISADAISGLKWHLVKKGLMSSPQHFCFLALLPDGTVERRDEKPHDLHSSKTRVIFTTQGIGLLKKARPHWFSSTHGLRFLKKLWELLNPLTQTVETPTLETTPSPEPKTIEPTIEPEPTKPNKQETESEQTTSEPPPPRALAELWDELQNKLYDISPTAALAMDNGQCLAWNKEAISLEFETEQKQETFVSALKELSQQQIKNLQLDQTEMIELSPNYQTIHYQLEPIPEQEKPLPSSEPLDHINQQYALAKIERCARVPIMKQYVDLTKFQNDPRGMIADFQLASLLGVPLKTVRNRIREHIASGVTGYVFTNQDLKFPPDSGQKVKPLFSKGRPKIIYWMPPHLARFEAQCSRSPFAVELAIQLSAAIHHFLEKFVAHSNAQFEQLFSLLESMRTDIQQQSSSLKQHLQQHFSSLQNDISQDFSLQIQTLCEKLALSSWKSQKMLTPHKQYASRADLANMNALVETLIEPLPPECQEDFRIKVKRHIARKLGEDKTLKSIPKDSVLTMISEVAKFHTFFQNELQKEKEKKAKEEIDDIDQRINSLKKEMQQQAEESFGKTAYQKLEQQQLLLQKLLQEREHNLQQKEKTIQQQHHTIQQQNEQLRLFFAQHQSPPTPEYGEELQELQELQHSPSYPLTDFYRLPSQTKRKYINELCVKYCQTFGIDPQTQKLECAKQYGIFYRHMNTILVDFHYPTGCIDDTLKLLRKNQELSRKQNTPRKMDALAYLADKDERIWDLAVRLAQDLWTIHGKVKPRTPKQKQSL